MKKKTALTLSAIALLSAGITFGVKFKLKKDFEKTLKTVLIPNAEKELDKLLQEDAALNDSIVAYEQALKLLHQQNLTKYSHSDKPGIPGPFGEVDSLILKIHNKWAHELYGIFYNKLDNKEHEASGNWDTSDYTDAEIVIDKRDIDALKRAYVLTGGKSYLYPIVPDYGSKFVLKHPISVPDIDYYLDVHEQRYYKDTERALAVSVYQDVKTFETEDLAMFFDIISIAIQSTEESVYTGEFNPVIYPKNEHPGLKLAILKSIQSFIDAIDNSQKVFDEATLKALQIKINALLPIVEKEYKTSAKLKTFKASKTNVENKVRQQKEKVKVLKTTDIKELMKQQKKR